MTTLQDKLIARTLVAVKAAQDVAIDATKTLADAMKPKLPSFDSLPLVDKLPHPVEVVEKAFDLSTVLLAGARNVAVEATKTWTKPSTVKPSAAAPSAAKASTVKASTVKASTVKASTVKPAARQFVKTPAKAGV